MRWVHDFSYHKQLVMIQLAQLARRWAEHHERVETDHCCWCHVSVKVKTVQRYEGSLLLMQITWYNSR